MQGLVFQHMRNAVTVWFGEGLVVSTSFLFLRKREREGSTKHQTFTKSLTHYTSIIIISSLTSSTTIIITIVVVINNNFSNIIIIIFLCFY